MQGLNRTKHPLPYPMPPFNAKVLKASYTFFPLVSKLFTPQIIYCIF